MNEIETKLASLQPERPAIDRDSLMYEAGWAAAESARDGATTTTPSLRIWQAATCLSTAAALLLMAQLTLPAESTSEAPLAGPVVVENTVKNPANTNSERVDPPQPATELAVSPAVEPASRWPRQAMLLSALSNRVSSLEGVALTPRGLAPGRFYYPSEGGRSNAPATSRNLMRELMGGALGDATSQEDSDPTGEANGAAPGAEHEHGQSQDDAAVGAIRNPSPNAIT